MFTIKHFLFLNRIYGTKCKSTISKDKSITSDPAAHRVLIKCPHLLLVEVGVSTKLRVVGVPNNSCISIRYV
jgi:hypothetical protein